MRKFSLLLSLLVLAGCATPITELHHPKTGVTVKCGGEIADDTIDDYLYLVGPAGTYIAQANRDSVCVDKYEKDGYEVVPKP